MTKAVLVQVGPNPDCNGFRKKMVGEEVETENTDPLEDFCCKRGRNIVW